MPAKLILLWGNSGDSKTSLLQTFCEGFHRQYPEKKVRLYTCESAQMGPMMPSVQGGWLEYWAIDNAKYPFERINDAIMGGWPLDPNDPISPVIPAWNYQHVAICPSCNAEVYRNVKAPALPAAVKCDKCKGPQLTVKLLREANPENGIQHVGAVIHEGLTAYGELLMDNMSQRSAKGETIGENTAVRFKDGNYDVGASSRSSYGIAQRQMKMKVGESKHLPDSVEYVIWTATKEIGEDEFKKVPICGPKLPGSAATFDIPRWFGPTLSAVKVPPSVDAKGVASGEPEFRLYTHSYWQTWNPAIAKLEHICNTRLPADATEGLPQYYKFERSNKTLLWDTLKEIDRRMKGELKK